VKIFRLTRQIAWLLPGLAIKRWLGMLLAGFFCFALGLALALNLQPITFTIDLLRELAKIFPSSISGPLLLGIGGVLLLIGTRRTYDTFFSIMGNSHSGGGLDLLEALYRRNKLDHGPRVVAIGGGTGLSTLLRGLKHYTNNITAIVTVGDDGGSSGRLREEQGIIPPGDLRNCIAALADEEQLITELFQYRFRAGNGLEGHSFGNLFLTAMCRVTGDMMSAIKESSKVLNIRGRVLPSTLDNVCLVAELEDGETIRGESNIPEARKRIHRLYCEPQCPQALPEAIEAIQQAELILLGPGSLYTSVVPNLLIKEIASAIAASSAPKVYIANIMTQPGETDNYTVADHVQAIREHAPHGEIVNAVVVNAGLPEDLLQKYRQANYMPVTLDADRCREMGVQVIQKRLVDENETKTIRHNPKRLARSIIYWFKREYNTTNSRRRPPVQVLPKTTDGASGHNTTSLHPDEVPPPTLSGNPV
jgi:uncharacterized cofD-like protein